MYELSEYFEQLKVSAIKKAAKIKNDVHNVTLGTNSGQLESLSDTTLQQKENDICPNENEVPIPSTAVPIRQLKNELDIEQREKIQEAVEQHIKKFDIFTTYQNEIKRQQWINKQKQIIKNAEEQEQNMAVILKKFEETKSKVESNLKQHHKEIIERRKQYDAVLEAKSKEREMYNSYLDNKKYFMDVSNQLVTLIKDQQNIEHNDELKNIWLQFRELEKSFDKLIPAGKYVATEKDVENSVKYIQIAHHLKEEVETVIKKQIKSKEKVNIEHQSKITENALKKDLDTPKTKQQDINLDKFISKLNFKMYSELVDFQEQYSKTFKELLNNNDLKQFRFDCKKAVNIPVNSISGVSQEHLLDKYTKLSNLLRGEPVRIGDFEIQVSKHPQGVKYSTDLLAKTFVVQCDLLISSNPSAAFSYATLINSLWNEFPELGKLLRSYFYQECPYLIPFYPPRYVEQSDEEYYKSLGYRYIDGVIEKQDKFLKRITGIAKLYFALLIARPKKSQKNSPLGLKIAWNWFVSILKLEPQINVTATVVHTFLETVGYEMQLKYKKSFLKLFRILCGPFLELLIKLDSGGPVTRLQVMIQEFKENGNRFKPPVGVLEINFW